MLLTLTDNRNPVERCVVSNFPDAHKVYELAAVFRERVIEKGHSFLWPDQAIWTKENAERLLEFEAARYVKDDKIKVDQLARLIFDESPTLCMLAADAQAACHFFWSSTPKTLIRLVAAFTDQEGLPPFDPSTWESLMEQAPFEIPSFHTAYKGGEYQRHLSAVSVLTALLDISGTAPGVQEIETVVLNELSRERSKNAWGHVVWQVAHPLYPDQIGSISGDETRRLILKRFGEEAGADQNAGELTRLKSITDYLTSQSDEEYLDFFSAPLFFDWETRKYYLDRKIPRAGYPGDPISPGEDGEGNQSISVSDIVTGRSLVYQVDTLLQRVLVLQKSWSRNPTPAMKERGELIRTEIPDALRHFLASGRASESPLSVEGGDGIGNKARIPWVRIYSDALSPNPTSGWYVVILFARDGSSVFLSLNQGVTGENSGKLDRNSLRRIERRSRQLRSLLQAQGFATKSVILDLKDMGRYGDAYQNGNVSAYEYPSGSMPGKDQLDSDLDQLIEMLLWTYDNDALISDSGVQQSARSISESASQYGFWGNSPTLDDLAAATHLQETRLHEIEQLLLHKKQLIFEGPPGSGKTFVAEKFARYFAGVQLDSNDQSDQIELVQFHQSYSYEDFVEGIRPDTTEDGRLVYHTKPGIFRTFADRAAQNPDKRFLLIIDEINRGNVSRILGELMLLLEYRDKSARLPYSQELLTIPENLYIIGTMNSADRSLSQIDYALRRRFYFVQFHSVEAGTAAVLQSWMHQRRIEAPTVLGLFVSLNEMLSRELGTDDLQVGHSYFMRDDIRDAAVQEQVWRYAVMPLLREYLYHHRDRETVLQKFTLHTMLSAFLPPEPALLDPADDTTEDDR